MKTLATIALALALTGSAAAADPPIAAADRSVIELRQYKIVPGRRDALVTLFEREFIESQEAVGARLIGQFRDVDDPNRFTWVRGFADMAAREKALTAFYIGPVWLAHRAEANSLLEDNDNVLLLRPAWNGSGFGAARDQRLAVWSSAPAASVVVVTILYLWKAPTEGFAVFFRDEVAPMLQKAGLPVIAAYVPEEQPNNFPQLPVRQGEKLFVWFSRAEDLATFDQTTAILTHSAIWQRDVAPRLNDAQERPAQILHLAPTVRSLLR